MKHDWKWGQIGLLVLLGACSSKHQPAPVVDAGTYTTANRGILKTSRYKVKLGETLYSIAWRAGLNPNTLAELNHISAPYTIYPDQELLLQPKQPQVVKKSNVNIKVIKNENIDQTHKNVVKPTANVKKDGLNVKKSSKEVETNPAKTYSKPKQYLQKPQVEEEAVTSWMWPTKGKVIKGFSSSATGNKGIDIKGDQGQKVCASADGYVVYAGSALRGYGKLIIIRHNEDYLSAYAHNSRLRVKEQQAIQAGQHIADMGDTGTTDTRLHFEIRYQGKSVDPMKYLPKL